MFEYQYAYLFADSVFFVIWIVLFLIRRDLRKEMLVMSLLAAPFGFTQAVFLRDYWQPQYAWGSFWNSFGFEDLAFMFLFGGIAAVIYEEIFGKKHAKRNVKKRPYWMLGFIVLSTTFFLIGTLILGFNSIYVSSVLLLIIGITIITFRHDLIKDAFLSGTLLGGIFFLFYVFIFVPVFPDAFEKFWFLENFSGIILAGVPIEEMLWAFSFGFATGPVYEFFMGIVNKNA